MKYTEIKDKDLDELKKLLKEKKGYLFECKLKVSTMQLSNPNELRVARRDIAKILTAINAKKVER